jgi:hypothetical protein
MKSELVTIDLAKLAKEKNFKEVCDNWFWINGDLVEDHETIHYNKDGHNRDISRPTQDLLQRWLREVHKINIQIIYLTSNSPYYFIIDEMVDESYTSLFESDAVFQTYELCREDALIYGLNLIK